LDKKEMLKKVKIRNLKNVKKYSKELYKEISKITIDYLNSSKKLMRILQNKIKIKEIQEEKFNKNENILIYKLEYELEEEEEKKGEIRVLSNIDTLKIELEKIEVFDSKGGIIYEENSNYFHLL
jgi:hypothetical protein